MWYLKAEKIENAIVEAGGYIRVKNGVVQVLADVERADLWDTKEQAERAKAMLEHGSKLEVKVYKKL